MSEKALLAAFRAPNFATDIVGAARGLVIGLAGAVLTTGLAAAAAGPTPAMSPEQTADSAVAASVAAEAEKHAGQMGAAKVVASHFADGADSHHYPPSPGDGPQPAGDKSAVISGVMARFTKAVPDFRLDEVVSHRGPVITVTSLINGTDSVGDTFHDVAVTSYTFSGGKVVHIDSIHINPGASARQLVGGEVSAADHATAVKLADAMQASTGDGLKVAAANFAEMVAVISNDVDETGLVRRETLTKAITDEQGVLKRALAHYASQETVIVKDNMIILDNKTSGALETGETASADTHAVFHVTRGVIVGLEATHSPEGVANLRKIFAQQGWNWRRADSRTASAGGQRN
jgi:hypothetical protein